MSGVDHAPEAEPDDQPEIRFIFSDEKANRVVPLAEFAFKSKAHRDKHWRMLSDLPTGDYLADLYDANGDLVNSKYVTAAEIEQVTGKGMSALLIEGNAWEDDAPRRWQEYRAAQALAGKGT